MVLLRLQANNGNLNYPHLPQPTVLGNSPLLPYK